MSGDFADPGLFDLLQSKLGWIDSRQRVLAQNVANADTPGYRPRDIAPFADTLAQVGGQAGQSSQFSVEPVQTSPMHLAGYSPQSAARAGVQSERAPDGNAVGMEDQLTKIADDENAQALTGNLWKTYMGMFMTALGHG